MINNIFSKFRFSIYLVIVVSILSIAVFLSLIYLKNNHIIANKLNQEIIFNTLQRDSSNILTKVLYQYEKQKEIIKAKHLLVSNFLNTQKNILELDLNSIYKTINENDAGGGKPYNIYITDENLIIKNTTYKNDLGFDLSFAKETFKKHQQENIIGVSAPILEASSNKFFSFSDSYLETPHEKKILQISYTYEGFSPLLEELQNNIVKHQSIKDIRAYLYLEEHQFTADFYFKKYKGLKPSLEELQERIEEGKKLSKLNISEHFTKTTFREDGVFKEIYIVQNSPIFNDTKIIYSVLFDETEYLHKLQIYQISLYVVAIFFGVSILAIYLVKKKEDRLEFQDNFVQQSLHEIKTPLNIITLNNELRNMKVGEDKYSYKIDNAIRNLKTTYDDMSYIANKNGNINYPIKSFLLQEYVEQRIKLFLPSFYANTKDIEFICNSDYMVVISSVELERLIDNNLSNALKYSYNNSVTKVVLEANRLVFETKSNKIQHTKKIFQKYYRENNIKGGHGIGLNIVKEICKKYNFQFFVESDEVLTRFIYIL